MATATKLTLVYVYRGAIERAKGRRYVWQDGYSETGPDGAVCYPWRTKSECRADAKSRGGRALFFRSEKEVEEYFGD